jgi:hypothetical protein
MCLVNSILLKSPQLTNDLLEIGKETLIWGAPCDATIDINNVLSH